MAVVSGEIFSVENDSNSVDTGTLDEPVLVTVKRDLKAVLLKCWYVAIPGRGKTLLHEWDLWGPLLLCLLLGLLLHGSGHKSKDQPTIHFVHVFVLVWGGAAIVTLNAQLLQGKVSFFQSVCTLGYCLLPLTIAVVISRLMLTTPLPSSAISIIRIVVVLVSLIWSVIASLGFLSEYLPKDRKALAVYPVFLFYFAISCLILAQTNGLF